MFKQQYQINVNCQLSYINLGLFNNKLWCLVKIVFLLRPSSKRLQIQKWD